MSIVNPAPQFLKMPKSEVGTYALDLADLAAKEIPLPTTYCLPISTLKNVAEHNWLEDKFEQISVKIIPGNRLQIEQALKKVRKLILQQTIPQNITKRLFDFYQKKLNQDFVRLTASPASGFETEYKRENNIQGEVNLIESILKLWARNIGEKELLQHNLYPVAIVIQEQPQPVCSGIAYSQNPVTGDKTQLIINSCWGVYQSDSNFDQFTIDQRSWRIIDQNINKQQHYYKRNLDRLSKEKVDSQKIKKPSLDEKQAKKLAKLIKKIKLEKINQIKVHWLITSDSSILVSKIKPFNFINSQTNDSKSFQTIAVGQSVTSGYLTGRVSIIKSKRDLKNFQAGNIAVVDKLTRDHQILIETCSAILCQRGIEGLNIIKKIRHYQIPTIAHLNHLFKRVKDGQPLVVDAGAGKIYQTADLKPKNKLSQTTRTKLFLAVNQPDNVNSELNQISDGLGLIRSEHFYISGGYHPIKLIRTQKNKLKQRIAHQIINYYHRFLNSEKKPPLIVYRSLNLTSNQLLNLGQGNNFETQENNPYLGFRGASRYLSQPEIFNFELELIAHVNQKIDKPIILILPFVRTAFEWQQIQVHIRKKIPEQVLRPQVWLQITTPENLINLSQYIDQNLAGISINVKSIHALMHGIDPTQPDIFNQYQLDTDFFTDQLNKVKQLIGQQTHDIKALINLHEYNQTIIQQAVKLEYEGLTVRAKIAKQVKEQLIETESRVF